MKLIKNALCVFMSVLMLFSGLYAGVVGFAENTDLTATYRSVAYGFFKFTQDTAIGSNKYILTKDSNGVPQLTILGALEQYTSSTESADYEYADVDDSPIRAVSYTHKISAKDDEARTIANATESVLSIVDNIISYEYGVGLYTIPLMAEELTNTLKYFVGDDGEYLFLDGYTYYRNNTGDLVARSAEKTYYVEDDGELKYYDNPVDPADEAAAAIQEKVDSGAYFPVTLFEACNVDTVIQYMFGNVSSVNSGNWFHDFEFFIATDIETVLIQDGQNLQNRDLSVYETSVKWTNARSYDESGLKTQFYNNGYEKTESHYTDDIRIRLSRFNNSLSSYFSKYYADGVLDLTTNDKLLDSYYADITTDIAVFESISDNAKMAVFGQRAYSYMNLVTRLTPIRGKTTLDQYAPVHTYAKYQDRYGNNIQYKVTTDNITSLVHSIDALLANPAITNVLGMFLDLSEYGVDIKGADNGLTPRQVVVKIIENMLFSDNIVNLILENVYPLVCNLLDGLITDDFIEKTLVGVVDGINLANIVDDVVNNATSWNGLVYGTLASIGVTLTPAGVAYVWNRYGYLEDRYGYTTMFPQFRAMHDHLKAAKGGITDDESDVDGHNTGDYYAIGCETSEYFLDHWRDVDFSQMVWGINGNKEKFLKALDAVLAPLIPLLGVLLGNSKSVLGVVKTGVLTMGIPMTIYLMLNDNDNINYHLYNDILLPLLETLGVQGLISGQQFETNAAAITSDASRTPDTLSAFLNDGLLNPLLNWVTDILLVNPIQTVMQLLPNLSLYLTSGALLGSLDGLQIPIRLRLGNTAGAVQFNVYTLDVMELIGKDKIAFLNSVQGVLDLINLSVDTGEGIVGYSDSAGIILRPDDPNFNSDYYNEPVFEAYMSEDGYMNKYQTGEYTQYITAKDEEGNFTEYAIRNIVAYLYETTDSGGNPVRKVVNSLPLNNTEPEKYTPLYYYYDYTVERQVVSGDELITISNTYRVATRDEVPEQYRKECKETQSPITIEESVSLPPIMDYKLQACGAQKTVSSGRFGTFGMTDREGNYNEWAQGEREYIVMSVTDSQGTHETYGLVLLFLFRYILSALGYSEYSDGRFISEYTLLDAFGLNDEKLGKELISGVSLTLGDIIYHVCLNPDDIIAALFEILNGGEKGSKYIVNTLGNVIANPVDYSYAPEEVYYYTEEILEAAELHNDYQYGTAVLYNEYWTADDGAYFVDNLDDIAENVLAMLKLDDMNSLSGLINGLLEQYVFNNEMVTTIVGAVYSMLDGMEFDLYTILDSVLGVDYGKQSIIDALDYAFDGIHTEVYTMLQKQILDDASVSTERSRYTEYTFSKASVDRETGKVIVGESYDWGFENPEITAKFTNSEIFLRALSAALSPFSILLEYLFLGEDINILDIVHIPMYEIYHYAWIPLMEAIGATGGLVSFKDYFAAVFANQDDSATSGAAGNYSAFYYLLQPIVRFAEKVVESPIETVLGMIPNLMFVLTVGGLNGIINNIAHFAYVLLDILEPVVDAYPVLNSFLSNLEVGGVSLSLSLPLDVDLNMLVNELLEGVLKSALSFEIENENVILGYQQVEKEVDVPVLDENGEQIIDVATGLPVTTKQMQLVNEEIHAVGTLSITLPYLDLTTLCSGQIERRASAGGYDYIYINSGGGADFLTLVLRLVTETLFFEQNWENVANFLIGFSDLDDADDNDALLMEILMFIHEKAESVQMDDVLMKLILTIYKVLVPIADNLGARFKKVDFSITQMFSDTANLGWYAQQLMDAGEKTETTSAFSRIIELIKQFFAKIKAFFQSLFGGGDE